MEIGSNFADAALASEEETMPCVAAERERLVEALPRTIRPAITAVPGAALHRRGAEPGDGPLRGLYLEA